MSEESEFEVGAIHEDVPDERAKEEHLARRAALLTAIRAAVGAVSSYNSGHVQTEAFFLKNSGIARQTRAGDQWAYCQAQATHGFIADLVAGGAALVTALAGIFHVGPKALMAGGCRTTLPSRSTAPQP